MCVTYDVDVSDSVVPGTVHAHAETSVNEQGRVTIPAQVRREANIGPGSVVVVYVEDGRVVMETRDQLAERVRREVAAEWVGEGSVVDELIADRRRDAAAEAASDTAGGEREQS
jgi:AbrB family looped-hinge helix DNA binding protein